MAEKIELLVPKELADEIAAAAREGEDMPSGTTVEVTEPEPGAVDDLHLDPLTLLAGGAAVVAITGISVKDVVKWTARKIRKWRSKSQANAQRTVVVRAKDRDVPLPPASLVKDEDSLAEDIHKAATV
jgi:hypothetical protein